MDSDTALKELIELSISQGMGDGEYGDEIARRVLDLNAALVTGEPLPKAWAYARESDRLKSTSTT